MVSIGNVTRRRSGSVRSLVEILRLVGGSPHWWDATFSGSVVSTMSLRERLLFSCAEECLIWVGGDANMNGIAAGSWSDGVYVIVRTEDWAEAIMSVVIHDLRKEDVTKEQLLVTPFGGFFAF